MGEDTPGNIPAQQPVLRYGRTMEQQTLRDLLTERDIRMDAAAVLAGVSTSTISRICSGSEQAKPKTVVSLAKALGVSARRMQSLCDAAWQAAHPVAS